MAFLNRESRRETVQRSLREQPFLTDRELATRLRVSVQTIRLDRLALGIPEMRARALDVAAQARGTVRFLQSRDVFGELVDLDPGVQAISRLETGRQMAGGERGLPGHLVYAQAESLTLAVVSIPEPEIALARVKFRRAAAVGETLICKAQVIRRSPGREVVLALVRVGGDEIFRGKFEVLTGRGA